MPKTTSRNLGLDAVRAVAIGMVLLCHATPFYKPILERHHIDVHNWRVFTGVTGVELFFCLSGFLIGGILLGLEAAGPSRRTVGIFYVRRWMRTLPLYYLVLFVISDFPQLDPHRRVGFLSFVTLTQNLFGSMPPGDWFAISWSLTIEEWSYLLLPLVVFGLFGRTKRPVLSGTLAMCLLAFSVRVILLSRAGSWDSIVRTSVAGRLDAICYGILSVVAFRQFHDAYLRWIRRFWWAMVALFLLNIYLFWHSSMLDGIYGRIFALSVASLSFSSLLPLIMGLHMTGFLAAIIRFIAKISYGMYLFHWPVYFLTIEYVADIQGLPLPVFVFGTIMVSGLVYYLVERPILRLRPSQFGRDENP
ncbi:MAG TPA: acyltransferase [Opitutaceae bacterium]|jgi:peptidoglycan/LPS O-acetylase OafA/YrhL|nr:acyltransferase [Opitutaceae bacterium]